MKSHFSSVGDDELHGRLDSQNRHSYRTHQEGFFMSTVQGFYSNSLSGPGILSFANYETIISWEDAQMKCSMFIKIFIYRKIKKICEVPKNNLYWFSRSGPVSPGFHSGSV